MGKRHSLEERLLKAIVTVRLPKDPMHNPKKKRIGICPLFSLQTRSSKKTCTDITGEHHSYLEEGTSHQEIEEKAKRKFDHITRIEVVE